MAARRKHAADDVQAEVESPESPDPAVEEPETPPDDSPAEPVKEPEVETRHGGYVLRDGRWYPDDETGR